MAVSGRERSGGVRVRAVLDLGAIRGALPGMGGMFRVLGMGVPKAQKGPFNVPRHGDIDSAIDVIPMQGKSTIAGGIPILSDFVVVPEGSQEMFGFIWVGVSDKGKVVDN